MEYEAILVGINLEIFLSSENIIIQSDSKLVVGQVNREYENRDQRMAKYVSLVNLRLGSFVDWWLEHILRDSNEKEDALAVVVASLPIKGTVFLLLYYQAESLTVANRVHEIDGTSSWMTSIVHYLRSKKLSNNRIEAHKILVQSARSSLVNGKLHK